MWSTETTEDYDRWFAQLNEDEQIEVAALIHMLKVLGPHLRRPHADTLKGSAYVNMKELRARVDDAVIRIAFAFDPLRTAILLVGGNKSGVSEKRFYRKLIDKADRLYEAHLDRIKQRKLEKGKGE